MENIPPEYKKNTSQKAKILLVVLSFVLVTLLYTERDLIINFISPSSKVISNNKMENFTKEENDIYQKALKENYNKDYQKAKQYCEQILNKYPNNSKANDMMALILTINGNHKAALPYVDKAINTTKNPLFFFHRAQINTDLKNYRNALQDYSSAIKLNNNYDNAYLKRAELKRDYLYDYKGAIEDFKSYLKIHPNNGNVMRAIAKIQNENFGSPHDALDTLNELVKATGKKECRTYLSRSEIYYSINKFDDAMADADTAFEICGNDAYAYNSLGIRYHNLKAYDKAISSYAKAREIKPTFSSPYYNEARIYQFGLKDNKKALEWYTKTVEVDPKNYDAYMNRANVYYSLEEYDKAIQDVNKYLAKYPDYVPAIYNRGLYYEDKKDYLSAVQDFNLAINYNPRYAWAHLHKGLASVHLNDFDTATKEILMFLDIGEASANIANYYTYFNQGYAKASQKTKGTKEQFEEAELLIGPKTGDTIKLFDKVMARNKDNPFFYLLMPDIKKDSDVPHAEYYKQAEAMNPKAVDAMKEVIKKLIFYRKTKQDWMPLGKEINLLENTYPKFFYWYLTELELTKDLNRAKELSDKVLKVNPFVSTAPYTLGYKYYQAGEYMNARKAIKQAIDLNPYFTHAYLVDLLLDLQAGNRKEAEKKVEKINDLRKVINEVSD